MTTIAWDGTSIAADRLAVNNDVRVDAVDKMFTLADGSIVAGCGNIEHVAAVVASMRGDEDVEMPESPEVTMCHWRNDGTLWIAHDQLRWRRCNQAYFAMGTGRDFALSALELGCTAQRAVELAIKFDVYSGGPVAVAYMATNVASMHNQKSIGGIA